MNKHLKLHILIVFCTIIIIITISNILIRKVTANELNSNNSATINDANIITPNQAQSVSLTRKPPVSIINYSNEITESSDTYDYSNKDDLISENANLEAIISTTPTPVKYTQPTSSLIETNQTSNVKITKKIFIGDSRTVQMKAALGSNNDIWSCKGSMGLSWLKSTGVPTIESQITNGTAVIILMGVNDLYNTNNYIKYLNEKAIQWNQKGAVVYYVSVNPINEKTYFGFKNTKIETFNNAMQSNLKNITYIDTYNYLITHDTSYTNDGLHYNNSTSKKIYELINNKIN